MNSKAYRWCSVPLCTNTSIKTPEKLFIFVPFNKTIRNKWLKLARRDLKAILPTTQLYFCEDHFNLPNDMENYMEYHVMGSVSQIRMKRGCVPLKFHCQPDRRKRMLDSDEREYFAKKQRKEVIAEFEQELQKITTTTIATEQLEFKDPSLKTSAMQENITQDAPKMANKSIQVYIKNKFRSKAVQTNTILVNQMTSPLRPFCQSASTSTFKIKSKTVKPSTSLQKYTKKLIATLLYYIRKQKVHSVQSPSVATGTKLSIHEAGETEQIESLRIHVQRVIRRLCEFSMLKPHACGNLNLVKVLDDVISIACGLVNLQDSLIKNT